MPLPSALEETASANFDYCADQLRAHDRDLYLLALFVPEPARGRLIPLYALASELAHIRHLVREEMIGHIRYAWWRETLAGLYAGRPRPGHPVLEALQPQLESSGCPEPLVMALLEAYAAPFPDPPQGEDAALEALTLHWLSARAPAAVKPWKKAFAILTRHKARHGRRFQPWLMIKLLLAGFASR